MGSCSSIALDAGAIRREMGGYLGKVFGLNRKGIDRLEQRGYELTLDLVEHRGER